MSEKRPDPPEYRPVIRADLVKPLKHAAAEADVSVAGLVNQAVEQATVKNCLHHHCFPDTTCALGWPKKRNCPDFRGPGYRDLPGATEDTP